METTSHVTPKRLEKTLLKIFKKLEMMGWYKERGKLPYQPTRLSSNEKMHIVGPELIYNMIKFLCVLVREKHEKCNKMLTHMGK